MKIPSEKSHPIDRENPVFPNIFSMDEQGHDHYSIREFDHLTNNKIKKAATEHLHPAGHRPRQLSGRHH